MMLFAIANPKKFWSYAKEQQIREPWCPSTKEQDSSVCVTDKDKAESLNSYLHSIFTQEQMPVPNIGISPFPSISGLQISPAGVFKQLSQLNP